MTRSATLLLATICLWHCFTQGTAGQEFKDEPAAHALYNKMIAVMREADSLYYKSEYRCEAQGRTIGDTTYQAWLKKPNQFRLEARLTGADAVTGVLVGDGDDLWIYWPMGKPGYGFEFSGEFAKQYEKHRMSFYMTKPTPLGGHSIGHAVIHLGKPQMSDLIFTPRVRFSRDGKLLVASQDSHRINIWSADVCTECKAEH